MNQRSNPLLINESPMQFLPSLACVLGVDGALFAQQLHYCLNAARNPRYVDGRAWVYNTLDVWNLQFPFWSKSTLRRTLKKLQAVEIDGEVYHVLLIQNYNTNKMNRCQWFSLDYDELDRLIPIAQKKVAGMQREIAEGSESVKRNIDFLSHRYPSLRNDNPEIEFTADSSRSAQNEQMHVSNPTDACVQNEHMGESQMRKTDVFFNKTPASPVMAHVSKSTEASVQNEQMQMFKMNTCKCSKWTHASVQNEHIEGPSDDAHSEIPASPETARVPIGSDDARLDEFPTSNQRYIYTYPKGSTRDSNTQEYEQDINTRDTSLSQSLSPTPTYEARERETGKEQMGDVKENGQDTIGYLKSVCKSFGLPMYANDIRSLSSIASNYPLADIISAIKIAVSHDARSFSYVISVLQRAQQHGGSNHETRQEPHPVYISDDARRYAERKEQFWREHKC